MWEPPARAVPREEKTARLSQLLAQMYKSSEGELGFWTLFIQKIPLFSRWSCNPFTFGLINLGLFLAKKTALTESFRTQDHTDPQETHVPVVDSDQFRQRNRLNPTPSTTSVNCWGLWHIALQRKVSRKLYCSNWSKWSKLNSAPYPGISLTAPWTEAELWEFISTAFLWGQGLTPCIWCLDYDAPWVLISK